MKKSLLFAILMSVLVGCVEVPAPLQADNTAPLITLESTTLLAYPGTTFQVDATIEDAESAAAELRVSWEVMSGEATVTEQSNEAAQFSIDLQANAGQQIVVVARVSDPKGLSAETTITIDIQAEPSVIVDAKTDAPTLADQDPIYTIGVYSGRRVNIKSQDTLASTNYLIDQSPNGRFVFYTQQFSTGSWQANLYDLESSKHYVVDMDFANRDIGAMESFWSNDSQYLAVKAPHATSSNSDRLYSLSVAEITDSLIETTREIVSFDHLIWSDNFIEAGQQAYAALIGNGEVRVFNPAAENQRVQTLQDNTLASAQSFQFLNEESVQWASNQLLFTASVTFTNNPEITPYRIVLYRWQSSNAKTKELTDAGGAQSIDQFTAYSASSIMMNANDSLWYYDGSSETPVAFSNISSLNPDSTELRWSPLGRRIAVITGPTNASTVGRWKFVTWNTEGQEYLHADWDSASDPNVTSWAWNKNQDSISLLSVNDPSNQSKLLDGVTNANFSFSTKIDPINHISDTENGYELRNQLHRSPNGKWQLFWAADGLNASRHLDLWAYNTETQLYKNVSRLKDNYLNPDTEGSFEEVAGFGLGDSTLAHVGQQLVWLSANELVFTVGPLVGSDAITDIRMINLIEDEMAHSLLVRPTEISEITALIAP